MLFDRICAENGIRHLLTAPRSPTTTGKVERLHKTMRAEFLTDARSSATPRMAELQAALDAWVMQYNTERPHQALGMRPPIERFRLAGPAWIPPSRHRCSSPADALPSGRWWSRPRDRAAARGAALGGPARPDLSGRVPLPGADRAGRGAGRGVAAEHLVRIFHRDVLVAEHVQRRKPDTGDPQQQVALRQGSRRPRRATDGLAVTRVVGLLRRCVVRRHQLSGRERPGAAAACRSASWPIRCSSPVTARSCGCIRSGTTGPRSTARSPPRTGGPATDRMRRPGPASRPRRCAVGLPAEP